MSNKDFEIIREGFIEDCSAGHREYEALDRIESQLATKDKELEEKDNLIGKHMAENYQLATELEALRAENERLVK